MAVLGALPRYRNLSPQSSFLFLIFVYVLCVPLCFCGMHFADEAISPVSKLSILKGNCVQLSTRTFT